MTRTAFWRAVATRLAAGESVFVALVVAHTRGSPGTLGARLWLDAHGHRQGTIGGGIMESHVLAAGRAALAQGGYRPHIRRLVHRKNGGADASGLICAGEQTNLTAVLSPQADLEAVACFVRALEDQDEAVATLFIDANGLRVENQPPDEARAPLRLVNADGDWSYAEESVARRRLAIVGGGHCGRALAGLGVTVGYTVAVFDTRSAVLAGQAWPDEVVCHVLDNYAELGAWLKRVTHTAAVVMTTAVTDDIEALTVLAPLACRWLGVMGSPAKIHAIRGALRERGIAKADIDAIAGPVGLPMKSDTPAEIAVSIMAQLLANEKD